MHVHVHVHLYTFSWPKGVLITCLTLTCTARNKDFRKHIVHVGVLCCFALFVCLTLLASFFLPSHLSFKNMYTSSMDWRTRKYTNAGFTARSKDFWKHIVHVYILYVTRLQAMYIHVHVHVAVDKKLCAVLVVCIVCACMVEWTTPPPSPPPLIPEAKCTHVACRPHLVCVV